MNTKSLFISLVWLVFVGSGCAAFQGTPTNVVLKHPQTMDFVDCRVDEYRSKKSYAANEKCIKDYQDKGYVIWGKQ